jgi:hypothetical protein
METISIVVTAPHGIDACLYLEELALQADAQVEILVIDGTIGNADRSRQGLRHIFHPDDGIEALIMRGLNEASLEWVLVTEDHCRPLPHLLTEYRKAIRANPDMLFFSGATDVLTSTDPWSLATFLVGLHDLWPPVACPPRRATNANLLVRRSVLREAELATAGGLFNVAAPRLLRDGRHIHCRDAVVDHVIHLSALEAIAFQFGIAATGRRVRHATAPVRPLALEFLRDLLVGGYFLLMYPARIFWRIRHTRHLRLSIVAPVFVLSATHGLGLLWADAADILQRLGGFAARQQRKPA